MPRSIAIALLPLAVASPALAQQSPRSAVIAPEAWKIPRDSTLQLKRGFALPVSDYVAPDGARTRQRGIIAGIEVAPQTLVGIGFFEGHALRPVPSSEQSFGNQRRSRKAAIGVRLKF